VQVVDEDLGGFFLSDFLFVMQDEIVLSSKDNKHAGSYYVSLEVTFINF